MANKIPAVTRFQNRGVDGPVSGAIQAIQIVFDSVTASTSHVQTVNFPAGMGFKISDAEWTAESITSTPALTIGDTAAGTQVVASVNLATNTGALTIKDGVIDAGGLISCKIVAGAGETVTQGNLTIVGYATSPPTSLLTRGLKDSSSNPLHF